MKRFVKSTPRRRSPIGGMITSCTNDDTIFPNAPPMITPTARSMTLPRIANSLNSLNTEAPPLFGLIRMRTKDQDQTHKPARPEHKASNRHKRPDPRKWHARHRQHHDSEQYQRK